MGDLGLDDSVLQPLQAKQKGLLDTISHLRHLGVHNYVDLPQIIVVGDQSSGKSSVLEAISRVRFPVKNGLCTRFATELRLQKAAQTDARVEIIPTPDDPSSVKRELEAYTQSHFNTAELPRIIEELAPGMGIDNRHNNFSKRILRIEISGPELPQLTLIDLPGFYYSESEDQSSEGRAIVNELVRAYMKQSNSIILAIISAENELVMQRVLRETKKHDPKRQRTLGIVTKPDQLSPGSSRESKYIQLIQNKEKENILKPHSWHVLRNRSEKEDKSLDGERDSTEADFFESGIWSDIPAGDKGIASLRVKLSGILLSHIELSLPGVIEGIKSNIVRREQELVTLGESRSTPKEFRVYLERIAQRFTRLAEQAIEGDYKDGGFFGDLYPSADHPYDTVKDMRNLRSRVRNLNRAFVAVISTKGARRSIRWRDGNDVEEERYRVIPSDLQEIATSYDIQDPILISEDDLEQEVQAKAHRFRGREFPGMPNNKLALTLFEDQAKPWRQIAARHIELVTEAAELFVRAALFHSTREDEDTRERLLAECIDPFFQKKRQILGNKLEELLPQYNKTGYSLPLEDDFERRVGQRTMRRLTRQVQELLPQEEPSSVSEKQVKALRREVVAQAAVNIATVDERYGRIHQFGIERVIDNMVEYYGMTLTTFIDNVVILAIENQLMCDIPTILGWGKVAAFDDAKLEALAAESDDSREKREGLTKELVTLKQGLRLCQKHRVGAR